MKSIHKSQITSHKPQATSHKNKGLATLLTVILILSVSFITGMGISLSVWGKQKIARSAIKSAEAYYAAEAGIEDSVYRVKKIKGLPTNYTITTADWSVGVSVNTPDQKNKIITALANVNNTFRKIEAYLTKEMTSPDFFYGAQAGILGIEMENNSRIEGKEGTTGNVYSNGPIKGNSGATITGDVFIATGISQDQSHDIYNSDQIFGQAKPVIDLSQSFKPGASNNLAKISIYIKKIGEPGDINVKILTDSAGSPSKTSLASATLQNNLVGASYGWVDIVFPFPPILSQENTYWLMIDASSDKKNYWSWGKDINQGYSNGQAKYSQDWSVANPNWASIAGDLNFKTFMGGQITSLENVIVSGNAHANTIIDSKICGDAYYQIIDASSLNFLNSPAKPACSDPLTSGTAYPNSSDSPLQNMPVSESNINSWKQEAAIDGIYTGDLIVNNDMSYGPKKIQGNLILKSNNKTLTVTGTIYITGYIDVDNGSTIRCAASYGTDGCVVVADGWIHIKNNGAFEGSGQTGSYLMLLSASPCDGSQSRPDCTDHNAAVDLHNNAVGAIFYANDGLIFIHNGVEVSELTAKKIHLEQNAIVRYEQGLASASFSGGPSGGWKIEKWQEIY